MTNGPKLLPSSLSGQAAAWRGIILCTALVISAVAYSFRFTSFLHAKEVVLCLSVAGIAWLTAASGRLAKRGFAAFLPLFAFVAMALIGSAAIHAATPAEVATRAASWLLLILGAALVFDLCRHERWRVRVLDSIGASAVAVAALGLLQYAGLCPALFPVFPQYTQRVYSVFGNQDLYGGYLALGIPILLHAAASKRRIANAAILGLALTIPAIAVSGSRTAWLAASLGAGVVLKAHLSGQRPRRRFLFAALLCLSLAAFTAYLAPESTSKRIAATFKAEDQGLQSRLWMWQGALRMAGDAPLLGVGLNNFGYWSPRYLGESLQGANGNPRIPGEIHADQPHSEPLRLLAETGLAGFACWVWMGVRVMRAARSKHRPDDLRSPLSGTLLALAAFALFNGPFDSPSHVFVGLLTTAMLMASGQEAGRPETELPRAHAVGAALAVSLLALFLLVSVWIPSYLLRTAEDAHLGPQTDISRYTRATDYPWPNPKAHKEYGFALAEAGRDEEAYRELLAALQGADTGDIYLALAILASRRTDTEAARHWAIECLSRWPGNAEALKLRGL